MFFNVKNQTNNLKSVCFVRSSKCVYVKESAKYVCFFPEFTKDKWEKSHYNEAFRVIAGYKAVPLEIKYEQQSEYNLIAAAQRQKDFYYQVSLPHYRNFEFCTNAIDRYKTNCLLFSRLHLIS